MSMTDMDIPPNWTLTGVQAEKASGKRTYRLEAIWRRRTSRGIQIRLHNVGTLNPLDVDGSKAEAKQYAEANPPVWAL